MTTITHEGTHSEVAGDPAVGSAPYKLIGRAQQDRTMVRVGPVEIGPGRVVVIAGPCAVESLAQILRCAQMARRAGACLLRGGAFKPRTSPYSFQGLGREGLELLAAARAHTGLPVVTEVMDPADVPLVADYADMLQIGTRSMQNIPLLRAVGTSGRPVLLKRGMSATVDEWLLAAEYIADAGNPDIVLCERGIRTFEPATRNTLDVSAVPLAQSLSRLPVIVDPSHAAGRHDLVAALGAAAVAAGADGLLVDAHHDPAHALCDGGQALDEQELRDLIAGMRVQARYVRRTLTSGWDQRVPPFDPGTAPAGEPKFQQPVLSVADARADLQDLRHHLDAVDEQLMALVAERLRLARQVGTVKAQAGLPVRDTRREEEVLATADAAITRHGGPGELARQLMRILITHAVHAQARPSLDIAGPAQTGMGRASAIFDIDAPIREKTP